MRSLLRYPNFYEKIFYFFLPSVRMSGKSVNFGEKINFYKNKKTFKIDDIDVNKILVSNEEPNGKKNSFKYLIGYNDVIRLLRVKLSQMIVYVKCFGINKTMSFKISDNKLLKNCTQIWKIVKKLLNIKFDSELVYGDNGK